MSTSTSDGNGQCEVLISLHIPFCVRHFLLSADNARVLLNGEAALIRSVPEQKLVSRAEASLRSAASSATLRAPVSVMSAEEAAGPTDRGV